MRIPIASSLVLIAGEVFAKAKDAPKPKEEGSGGLTFLLWFVVLMVIIFIIGAVASRKNKTRDKWANNPRLPKDDML